jgi:Rieske Fe-S protein
VAFRFLPGRPARLTRRDALRAASWLALAPLGAAAVSMVRRLDASRPTRRLRLGPDFAGDVTFADEVIVHRQDGGRFTVFSARCPHLGCRIARLDGDQFVCPCHGSRFALDGSVARGPATRPLQSLPYTVDPGTGALVVDVT